MTQIPEYERGRRDGMRWAVTWISNRAKAMNDPHARQVLFSASTNLGWALRHTITGDGDAAFWKNGAMLLEETEEAAKRHDHNP